MKPLEARLILGYMTKQLRMYDQLNLESVGLQIKRVPWKLKKMAKYVELIEMDEVILFWLNDWKQGQQTSEMNETMNLPWCSVMSTTTWEITTALQIKQGA